jgi:hypothetical protein
MTPKEKAEELYNKYLILIVDDIIDMKIIYGTLTHKLAKQSALIAVDEIIQTLSLDGRLIFMYIIDWWKDVKNEIDRL